jgi:hypothetical protein
VLFESGLSEIVKANIEVYVIRLYGKHVSNAFFKSIGLNIPQVNFFVNVCLYLNY